MMSQNKTVNKKLISIGTAIGIFAAAILIAYAVGSVVFKKSFVVEPTYTYSYDIDLTNTTVAVGDLLPGDRFTVSPTITSKSTGNSYVFVRINCENDSNDTAIYNFVPAEDSGWTTVKRDNGMVLVAYGTKGECTKLGAGDEVTLNGSVVLDIGYADYAQLAGNENPLRATFTVCGIHSDQINEQIPETESEPLRAYNAYVNEAGE